MTPPPAKENIIIDSAVPIEPRTAARLTDTEPAPSPKSAASETVVSQRGNTLQVPKVSPALGKPPQPIAPKLRKAQRTNGGSTGSNLDWGWYKQNWVKWAHKEIGNPYTEPSSGDQALAVSQTIDAQLTWLDGLL